MSERISPLAGKPVPPSLLVNIPRLVTAYFALVPDPAIASQRVAFGTSGHRGSAFAAAFNEAHILAIAQAVCLYRRHAGIDGPLFLGMDTHALSEPAFATAIEVLAANGVETMIDEHGGYTPTPVISHAILSYNRGRKTGLADGIVISPSHNPPDEGGFKYNPANGGPADVDVTGWIEKAANEFLVKKLDGVARIPYERARKAACIHAHDYITPYVADLANVVDLEAVRAAGVRIGIDPLGGAAVQYWQPIIERYKIAATVVNDAIDPTFRFHDRGLGRKDPDGLLVALRDDAADRAAGQIRHRLRQRHRRRPAWNRLPVGRTDEPELLSRGGDFLFVREPAGVAP